MWLDSGGGGRGSLVSIRFNFYVGLIRVGTEGTTVCIESTVQEPICGTRVENPKILRYLEKGTSNVNNHTKVAITVYCITG